MPVETICSQIHKQQAAGFILFPAYAAFQLLNKHLAGRAGNCFFQMAAFCLEIMACNADVQMNVRFAFYSGNKTKQ
jgi:hypothetical protein